MSPLALGLTTSCSGYTNWTSRLLSGLPSIVNFEPTGHRYFNPYHCNRILIWSVLLRLLWSHGAFRYTWCALHFIWGTSFFPLMLALLTNSLKVLVKLVVYPVVALLIAVCAVVFMAVGTGPRTIFWKVKWRGAQRTSKLHLLSTIAPLDCRDWVCEAIRRVLQYHRRDWGCEALGHAL